MPDVFISYSRKDKEFVRELRNALSKRKRDVWVDLEDIPDAYPDWLHKVHVGIEAANNFVFVLSPDSLQSEVCGKELMYAIENNKRIIPILYRNVDTKMVPLALGKPNWIHFVERGDFDDTFERLNNVIDIDPDYVDDHTRILVLAKEWQEMKYDSRLLRGKDLEYAEDWIGNAKGKTPPPTELHYLYIKESKRHQLQQDKKWEDLYRTANDEREKAEKALAENYKEQGRFELLNGNSMRSAVYLNEAYKMGLDDQVLRFLLAQAMPTVDAQLVTMRGHRGEVESVEFSADGKYVITSSSDKTSKVWEVLDGKLVNTLNGHTASVKSALFSPNCAYIATASEDKTVRIWDANYYNVVNILQNDGAISLVVFSPNSQFIVTATGSYFPDDESQIDSNLRIWEVSTGRLLSVLSGHTKQVTSASFSHDSTKIVSGSLDGKARIWDSRTGQCLRTLENQEDILCLEISPDGSKVVAGDDKGKVTVWDIINNKAPYKLKYHLSIINHVSFSPDGRYFVTASLDKSAIIWETETGKLINRLEGHSASVTHSSFSPDGTLVATASMDRTVRLWEAISGRLIESFQGHTGEVLQASFSPDGTIIATASWDKTAKLWDAVNRRFLSFPDCKSDVLLADFNTNGSRVITIA